MSWANEVTQISRDLWCLKDVQSVNKYLVVGDERALLFDTGYGFVDYRPAIREITDKPLFVVDSHAHPDHCLGNFLFDEVYLSRYDYGVLFGNTNEELKRSQLAYRLEKPGSRLAEELDDPDAWLAHSVLEPRYHLIDAGHRFELGGIALEVIALPGHSPGSIALYERERGWLFTGDSVADYNVYYFAAGDPRLEPAPLATYWDALRKLDGAVGDCELYPAHGRFPVERAAIGDALRNLEEIHAGAGEEHEIMSSLGFPAREHRVGTSLIYYTDDIAAAFRAAPLPVA